MNKKLQALFVSAATVFASATVFANQVPEVVYQPKDAQLIKQQHKHNGEYEATYSLPGNDVRPLAQEVEAYAKSKGFNVVKSEIRPDDAEFTFRRDRQELEVSIEAEKNNLIEYEVDFEIN
ncbi:hypothetical protein EDC45_0432 [Mesocricetibacter intestinalis]|uniref:YpeB-like protein with protease inhibitory function n=1 Tax=Mesocricetibacter intestinalis TaxID=1521930 RepID=A0A4R6VFX3_9PAST|nr:hypothetical protein [Mesocricetibacter intestinalis]TDQ59772.1 hypothetical protein EDC45_0432 [Mesocricetibacter intestinalis]